MQQLSGGEGSLDLCPTPLLGVKLCLEHSFLSLGPAHPASVQGWLWRARAHSSRTSKLAMAPPSQVAPSRAAHPSACNCLLQGHLGSHLRASRSSSNGTMQAQLIHPETDRGTGSARVGEPYLSTLRLYLLRPDPSVEGAGLEPRAPPPSPSLAGGSDAPRSHFRRAETRKKLGAAEASGHLSSLLACPVARAAPSRREPWPWGSPGRPQFEARGLPRAPGRPRAGRREASFQPRSWPLPPARAPGIMNIDVEFHIRHNYPWSKLPANVRQVWNLGPGSRLAGICSPRPVAVAGASRLIPGLPLARVNLQPRGEEGTLPGPQGQDRAVAKWDGMVSTGLASRLCTHSRFSQALG